MPFLERDEVRVHYEILGEGDGPWATLVNGYTRPLTDLRGMARFLAERKYRVLIFDNRGAGKAECPPVFTVDDIGDDVLALWDHLGVAESFLMGISYGGAISSRLAARENSRVRKLALISTPLNYEALSQRGPQRDPRKLQVDLLRYFSPGFAEKNKIVIQAFIRQMGQIFQEPDTALGARAQRGSMEELDLTETLPSISIPTLVLHGDQDRVVPLAEAKSLAALLPKGELQVFEGIGHLLLAECPRRLYETVEAFFATP